MADNLTEKDIASIKKALDEAIDSKFDERLEPFANSVQNDFQQVNERLDDLENNLQWMKNNFGELFTKLDKFITLYEDQRQELQAMAKQIQRLEDRVEELESQKG